MGYILSETVVLKCPSEAVVSKTGPVERFSVETAD
jgi:hypothetical protein